MKNITDSDLHALVAAVRSSKKYRDMNLPVDFLIDLAAQAASNAQNLAEVKTIFRKSLHNVIAPYLETINYTDETSRLQTTPEISADIRDYCRQIMQKHASTRERIPCLEDFAAWIIEEIGQPETILDLYNVLTAVTLFRTLGYSADEVKSALLGVAIGKSRKEVYKIGGTSIYRMLAKGKNPIAVSRVLDAVDKLPGKKQFILLVDTSVDKMSEEDNAAWIYDAELSILTDPDVKRVIVGGRRSEDIRIALLFQGVPEEKIITCRDKLDTAKYIAKTNDPETIAILYELYSAPVAKKVMEAVKNQLVHGLSESGGK